MGLFEWYGGLRPRIRLGVALVFLALSTVLYFCRIFWPYGWAIGGICLLFAFPSRAEKKGYHDF